jgi:cytochrome c oxidase subunit 2
MQRSGPVAAAGLLAAAAAALTWAEFGLGRADEPRVVRISAKQFEYDPPRVHLKLGQRVVLELTAIDRPHGFRLSALGIKVELVPGQVARIEVTPEQAGSFVFVCDVFCGLGHDDMDGTIVVEN